MVDETYILEDGDGIQAFDRNVKARSLHGYGVATGGAVSINTGTLGSGNSALSVASGEAIVAHSTVAISSQAVDLPGSDSLPRWDLVGVDSTGSVVVRSGTPEEAQIDGDPTDLIRRKVQKPVPPSVVDSNELTALAFVWIPADASSITADDLFDVRVPANAYTADVDMTERAGIPVYTNDTNAPNETLYFNSTDAVTNYKDSSGTVHEGGVGKHTLYMSDYAPTGGVVDTEFDEAVSDAAAGDRIVFDHNTYELAANHTVNKSITLDGTTDSDLIFSVTANNDPHISIEGSGIGTSTTTTEVANVGQRTITVTDETIFSAGDRVLFMEATYGQFVDSRIQFAEVHSVGTGQITIMNAISKELVSGTNVYNVDLLDSPTIQNLSTSGGGSQHFRFRWCEEPTYRNVSISEYLEVSLQSLDCWKPRYYDVTATDPVGTLSGEGEPVSLYRSTDGYVESARVYDCRRGIDFAWGARGHTIVDPVLHGCLIAGISVHSDQEAGSFSIIGGEIVCQLQEEDTAHNGHGISMSSTADTSIEGTRIVARANGIIASGETHATNVVIEPVDGTPEGNAGILIEANDCSFIGCRINDPDGLFDNAVWVNAASTAIENVDIDVDMDFGSENMVYVDGRSNNVKNVTIRGNYDLVGTTSQQGFLVHADDSNRVENIDIAVNIENHPDQAIRLLADATNSAGILDNINIHDCYFNSATAAIFSDGTGTFETVRVENCSMDTGSTALSLNDPIARLYIKGNDASGTIDTSGGTYRNGFIQTGTVTLSGGQGTVSTGVEHAVYPALDPSNAGGNASDIDVVASVRYDSANNENVVEITEDSTAVGNPTVGYTILGV